MKILLIHNEYKSLGGEDVAVKNEAEFLNQYHSIKLLTFQNNLKGLTTQIISFLTNRNVNSLNRLKNEIALFEPEIAYIHNTWFKASNIIFTYLEKKEIPIILKLHNFRYYCTRFFLAKNHFGNSDSCMACGGIKKKYSIFNKYYSESYIKSFFVILHGKKLFNILKNKNLKILVLTKFHKQFLINLGVNENKIFIFQNFLKKEEIVFRQNEKITLVYAGRISKEKGVEDLIRIFLDSSPKNTRLIIIGDGPQLQYLRSNYQNSCISFEGLKSNLEVKKIISNSSGVIIRTNLFENQPTILCEASMLSKPSIFPDNGGINEFFPRDYLLKYDISTDESLITILNKIDNFEFDIQTIGEENNQFITKLLSKERLITNFDNIVEKF